ncbi:MAG: transporter substrate-binding protein [Microbacteriaceae bacterium]|jgi:zinc/manganese transport system substrate-binding protein|nr:transporter substrate-binding protein [Microbacteriaceae bacterium]
MRLRPTLSLVIAGVVSVALAGCATSASGSSATPAANGVIHVVASTNVYGDIAKRIGGSLVSVTSIISDPAQDPHSYEADAQVQLALSKANVVIENGGGYDSFVDTLLKGANNSTVKLLNAATISGFNQNPSSGQFNEHLWYDFPTMRKVANSLAASFTKLDSGKAATFAANAAAFSKALTGLESTEATIKASDAGKGAAITEPVPVYLLEACGLVVKTPVPFSDAIENGTDVSPVVLENTLSQFSKHQVTLLAYNEQTTGPQTQQVLAAAKSAGVAIVPVTETLPTGDSYLTWMGKNLSAVRAALG